MLTVALCAASCKTTTLSLSEQSREIAKSQRREIVQTTDSIFIYNRDSVIIREKADTVFVEKWHVRTKFRDRLKTDTVRISDTVRIVETVVEKVVEIRKPSLIWKIVAVMAGLIIVLLSVKKIIKWW
ncbi:MAG: hypothetical protein LBG92_03075 [Prevotellaceae bacterium]|jgi:gamma-glutamyl phosphate reductase|nr:hypothetical protein [Prevotellaceae bacterium]